MPEGEALGDSGRVGMRSTLPPDFYTWNTTLGIPPSVICTDRFSSFGWGFVLSCGGINFFFIRPVLALFVVFISYCYLFLPHQDVLVLPRKT